MPTIQGKGQITLADLNDAIMSGEEPSNPNDGQLWVDESTNPNTLKRYSSVSGWIVIGELLDAGTGVMIDNIIITLGNMANDSVIDFSERQVLKDRITEIIGYIIADTATILPTVSTLDTSGKGSFYNIRKSAMNAGITSYDNGIANGAITYGQVFEALATKYNDLKTYLEGLVPIDAWDLRASNKDIVIQVDKTQWRDKWQAYYQAEFDLTTATAKKLKDNTDNVDFSGRNLILNSNVPITTTAYLVGTFNLSENFVSGETYTFVVKGSVPNGQKFHLWMNNGTSNIDYVEQVYKSGVFFLTFKAVNTTTGNERKLSLYNFPNNATSASLEWVALYKGNKPTDWTPAPEDKTDKNKVIFEINNSTETIKIQAKNIELKGSVTVLSDIADNLGNITAGHISGVTMDVAGGKFTVDKNGNAVFKGSLNGANGTFSGTLSSANGTFTGTLNGANGTFSGSLSGASGTFSGKLTADTLLIEPDNDDISAIRLRAKDGTTNGYGTFGLNQSGTSTDMYIGKSFTKNSLIMTRLNSLIISATDTFFDGSARIYNDLFVYRDVQVDRNISASGKIWGLRGITLGWDYVNEDGNIYYNGTNVRMRTDGTWETVTSQEWVRAKMATGTVTITPIANTATSKTISFGKTFASVPVVVATANTSVPGVPTGVGVSGVGVSGITRTGCTIWVTRTNTTDTVINWVAMLD